MILVFLGSYFDIESWLKKQRVQDTGLYIKHGASDGMIFIRIRLPGYWLGFDPDDNLTIREVTDEKDTGERTGD